MCVCVCVGMLVYYHIESQMTGSVSNHRNSVRNVSCYSLRSKIYRELFAAFLQKNSETKKKNTKSTNTQTANKMQLNLTNPMWIEFRKFLVIEQTFEYIYTAFISLGLFTWKMERINERKIKRQQNNELSFLFCSFLCVCVCVCTGYTNGYFLWLCWCEVIFLFYFVNNKQLWYITLL